MARLLRHAIRHRRAQHDVLPDAVGRYRGAYTRESIEADAGRIHGWLAGGRDVYVYFNNTIELDAVNNASELMSLLTPQ